MNYLRTSIAAMTAVAGLAAAAAVTAVGATQSATCLSANYRNWAHVKSMVIDPVTPCTPRSVASIIVWQRKGHAGISPGKFPDGA